MREYLERVRQEAPLIHNITNYVTANDVANILLACGASPIMADEPLEVEEITALCGGLAWENMQKGDGNATYRNRIIDAIYNMDGETLERGARYEIR